MAQQTPPYVISAATHSAALFRQANDAPFIRRGVIGANEYAVSQQASPNMSVQIGAGRIVVPGSQGVTPAGFSWSTQGSYFGENDASATLTIAASNPTNPRIDVVYVAVQDAFYSGATNQIVLAVVTGTAAASPSPPAVPANNYVILAQIAVAANATTIVNANISNLANVATALAICLGGVLPTASSASYPASGYTGQYIDDAATTSLMRWNGSSWQPHVQGKWIDYTPRLTDLQNTATVIASSISYARYTVFGKTVHVKGSISASASVTAGHGVACDLPLPARERELVLGGSAGVFLSTPPAQIGIGIVASDLQRFSPMSSFNAGIIDITTGQVLRFSISYEAA